MQLVVSGNRILAHGEGFLSMGGTVINTVTGRSYQNATVVECDGCPSDIDKVGYEYHAGRFIPCAPFGVGDGNLAVVCGEDCKSIKDSGLALQDLLARSYTKEEADVIHEETNEQVRKMAYMSDETAAKYGFSGENATVDNALDALAHYLLSQGITTVTVLDEDGNPISGVTFSGVVGSSGEAVSTDASGVAHVVVTTDVPVTFHTEYVDIPDYTETLTPNFEEINAVTVVMPYAESGHIETVLDSGAVKFRKARTVNVALVGGGNGGEPGESTFAEHNYGGSGGDGGKIYNASKSVAAETVYSIVIGAGGVGRARSTPSDEAQNGGNTTAFGASSASGTATTLAFSNSSIMAGGKGGTGGKAPSGEGYDGVRCGGKGGTGGPSVSAGGYSYGGKGRTGSAPGGGGGGGGGRAYVSNGMNSVSGSSYAGDGGDGAAGGVLIKF